MKVLVLTADLKTASKVKLAMRLRWPDAVIDMAPDAEQCARQLASTASDILFLDAMHPGINVPDFLIGIRGSHDIPILVMTETYSSLEAAQALEHGADDYFLSSAELMEIVARVVAMLRRIADAGQVSARLDPLVSGDLVVDPRTYEAHLGGERLRFTSTEFRLLCLLMRNREDVVAHGDIEADMWGSNANSLELVKKYVQRLRWKLGDDSRDPKWIASVHGVGYRFVGPGQAVGLSLPIAAGNP